MLIRITRQLHSVIGGLFVEAFKIGEVYWANVSVATYLIVGGYAEPVRKYDGTM